MKHIAWKCPNCQSALIPMLTEKPYVLRCERGHSFDLAKQGYVNLLLPQKRGAALPGDNAEMVRARTAFLDGGYYRAFSDGVNRMICDTVTAAGIECPVILDAGCGEGYYTARLHDCVVGYVLLSFVQKGGAGTVEKKMLRLESVVVDEAFRRQVVAGEKAGA